MSTSPLFDHFIAAIFNTFPNTTFSQNNGVIQMTGVASRHVGLYIAGILVFMGFFPVFGSLFLLIPKPVLGVATVILFGTIAVAGIRILAIQEIDMRKVYIMAISFGLGLGVTLVPDATKHMPAFLKQVVATPITLAGLSAITLSLLLPEEQPVVTMNPAEKTEQQVVPEDGFLDTKATMPAKSLSLPKAPA